MKQNVLASMQREDTADKREAHGQPQKVRKKDTHMTLTDRSEIMNVVSAYVHVCYVCAPTFFVALAHYA